MLFRTVRKYCTTAKWKTIYAVSTGQTRAGIAIVRVSGPSSREALILMTKISSSGLKPRCLYFTPVEHPSTKEIIDKGMAVWFPGPSTFTGEDSCEFHVHGGHAVVNDLLEALGTIPNFVPAEPGEFTKRAFFNGKLDLTAVEGLADLLNAETSAQRKLALRQTDGDLNKLYNNWRTRITQCVAHIEAIIDFGEEEQIDDGVLNEVDLRVTALRDEIQRHLVDSRSGELLRNGVHATIVGQPNVGKSSLLNLLCQRPAAIVTPLPGTTRDTLDVPINLAGYPVVLTDTAGIRRTEDVVEREGVKRAFEKLRRADLLLYVLDASSDRCIKESEILDQLDQYISGCQFDYDLSSSRSSEQTDDEQLPTPEVIIVFNKIDLIKNRQSIGEQSIPESVRDLLDSKQQRQRGDRVWKWKNKALAPVSVSCTTGFGIDRFLEMFAEKVASMCNKSLTAENATFTHQRHRYHVTQALRNLNDYFRYNQSDIVLAAENLRCSLRHLGQLTGRVTTDQILDVVFKDFCIGK